MTFDDISLTAPTWKTLNDDYKEMFNNWAENANGDFTGEQFFRKTFNWFLVIHELGHYIQFVKGTEETDDHYSSESEANNIAVSYWKINHREELDKYMIMVNDIIEILPVPEDTTAEYFNANYDNIGDKPEIYGYFQFFFIIESYNNIDSQELSSFL